MRWRTAHLAQVVRIPSTATEALGMVDLPLWAAVLRVEARLLETQTGERGAAMRLVLDATNWILPATRNTKYAHAPNYSVWGHNREMTACGRRLGDPHELGNKHAESKPPCPRCVRMLRHQLEWLQAWTDSYASLDWGSSDE